MILPFAWGGGGGERGPFSLEPRPNASQLRMNYITCTGRRNFNARPLEKLTQAARLGLIETRREKHLLTFSALFRAHHKAQQPSVFIHVDAFKNGVALSLTFGSKAKTLQLALSNAGKLILRACTWLIR